MEFSQSKIMKILKIASLGSNFTSSYKKSINKGHTHTHTHTHTHAHTHTHTHQTLKFQ